MWTEQGHALEGDFEFDDFGQALAFAVRVGLVAEQRNHHPDMHIRFNRVGFTLTTHDAGGRITVKDREMASIIESLYHSR